MESQGMLTDDFPSQVTEGMGQVAKNTRLNV